MKFCSKCGNQLEDEMQFCNKCGVKVETNNVSNQSINSNYQRNQEKQIINKRGKIWLICTGVFFIVLIVCCILATFPKTKKQTNNNAKENTSNSNNQNKQATQDYTNDELDQATINKVFQATGNRLEQGGGLYGVGNFLNDGSYKYEKSKGNQYIYRITIKHNPLVINGKGQVYTDTTQIRTKTVYTLYDLSTNKFSIHETLSSAEEKMNGTNSNSQVEENNSSRYLKDIAKEGDYIDYKVPEKSYTIKSTLSGYEKDQKFNTKNYEGTWQVLYNNDDYGLQIVSTKKVGNLYLHGEKGYNNAINVLNSMSSNYLNELYAKGARSIGTHPIIYEETEKEMFNFSDYGIYASSYVETYVGMKLEKIKVKGSFDDYNGIFKKFDENYIYDRKALYATNIDNEDTCWMASRKISNLHDDRVYFEIRTDNRLVITNENENLRSTVILSRVYRDLTYTIVKDDFEQENGIKMNREKVANGVKPVIILKDNIKVIQGEGTKENPYVIGF